MGIWTDIVLNRRGKGKWKLPWRCYEFVPGVEPKIRIRKESSTKGELKVRSPPTKHPLSFRGAKRRGISVSPSYAKNPDFVSRLKETTIRSALFRFALQLAQYPVADQGLKRGKLGQIVQTRAEIVQLHVVGLYVGVPVKLGAKGIEQIIEIKLTAEEKAGLDKSAAAVKELVGVIGV